MDASHRTIVSSSLVLAFVFTAGVLFWGLLAIGSACAIAFAGKGSWSALAVFGLIAACHAGSAVDCRRRYLLGRRRRKTREESVKINEIRD